MARIGDDTEVAHLPRKESVRGGIGGTTVMIDPKINARTETVRNADAIVTDMSLSEPNCDIESDHIRDRAADPLVRNATRVVTAANDVLAESNLRQVPTRLARTKIGRTGDHTVTKTYHLANNVLLRDQLPAGATTSGFSQPFKNVMKLRTMSQIL